MLTAVFPVFDSCTDCAAELAPTVTLPKDKAKGLTASEVWRPVPDRLTVCVPPLVVKTSWPGCEPITVGTNVTLALQLAPTFRLVEQFVATAYSVELVTEEIATVVFPEFVSVTVWALEVEPTVILPNDSEPTLATSSASSPVPESVTV